jgi:two-component SAPR family response regulator
MTPEPIKILLIEDEPDLRETLAELLEERGYHVETVSSSVAAVELAKEKNFDVVVTDIRTEGQYDGLSALEKVKERQPEVAGVVITGYSTEDYALRAVKLQVEDYLKKPFQLSDFIQRIESIASQKRKSKQEAQQQGLMRRTLLWFAEQVAQAGSRQAGLNSDAFLKKVETLAQKMRLGEELSQELMISGALTFAEEVMGLELPSYILATLPSSVSKTMRHRFERWDGKGEPEGLSGEDAPLGSRILKLALELTASANITAAELSLARPGEFDPALVEVNDSHAQHKEPIGDARSVLAVGLALEDAGEFEQALETFRVLARDYPGTRSEVFGALGQARMNRVKGDLEAAARAAERSFKLAKRQGPSLAALCGLQAGILLSQLNHEQGQKVLMESAQLLNEIRDVGGRSVCVLALAHFWKVVGPTEAAARTLLSSEFTPDLQASASWLTRYLLTNDHLESNLVSILLAKFAQDCPGNLIEACHDQSLTGEARAQAIDVLAEHLAGTRLQPILKELSTDESSIVRDAVTKANQSGETSQPKLPTLRIGCLGDFRVYRGDERLDTGWKRLKPKFFLAYLASLGTRTHSDDSLVEVFWPGDPDKGRASLRAALSYLRRQLQPNESEINYFLKPPGNVQLNPDLPIWYDLLEMEKSVSKMRQLNSAGQVEKAVGTARYVAKLYEGPFLENCYMDWAIRIRERTDLAVLDALTLLVEWCMGTNRYDEAIEFGQRVISIDPSLESVHLHIMRAYLAQGKPAEAVRQYDRCRKALLEELDVEPSDELQELRDEALQNQS